MSHETYTSMKVFQVICKFLETINFFFYQRQTSFWSLLLILHRIIYRNGKMKLFLLEITC